MGGKPGSGSEPRAQRDPSKWRADLIDPALTILIVALTAMLAIGMPLVPPPRFQEPFIAIVLVILAIVLLRFARRLPPWLRAGGAALGVLAAAVVGVTQLGFGPGLTIALAMTGAILSIAIGRGAAVLFFALAAASMLVLGVLAVDGRLPLRAGSQDPADLANWLRWIAVFFVSGTALAFVLHVVVRRIEAAARAQVAADQEHRRCTDALLVLAQDPAVESGELDTAFAAITDAAAAGLEVARAGLWMIEDGGRTLRRAATHPGPQARDSLSIADHAAYFAALTEGRTIAATDAAADGRTAELAAALATRGVSSLLVAPIRFREQLAGAVALEHVGPGRTWSAEARSFATALADFAARALAAAEREQRDAELREAYDLLGRLHRRVETAKEEERRHLARDMHDELGQILTALKLRLQMAIMNPAAGGGVLEASVDMVDRLIVRARQMSIDLSPPLLDEVGLAPAIRAHLERGTTPPEMRVDLDTAGLDERLPAEVETAAFRVVQESLTNAVRHAEARRVEISVRRELGHLALLVRDDGRGFDVAEARRASGRGEHFGVVGMTERVKGLGGTLEVRSRPGHGTEVHATLPVAPPR